MNLGQKALDCLRIAEALHGNKLSWDVSEAEHERRGRLWRERYEAACAKYSEKAVNAKMDELSQRGYLDCGVSVRTGWLTEKGRAALASAEALR